MAACAGAKPGCLPHAALQAVFNLDLDYSDDDALLDWEQYAGTGQCMVLPPSAGSGAFAGWRLQRNTTSTNLPCCGPAPCPPLQA